MKDPLDVIAKQAGKRRNFDTPPLHLWHPPLSGDIDIRIAADGTWYHEGSKIARESLVRLFCSILRREEDGDYYLVTPAEKWRIQVDLHPLIVTDITAEHEAGKQYLKATLNTGKQVGVDAEQSLFLEPEMEDIAALELSHGLSALFSRAAWYRLVELADERDSKAVVLSGDCIFPLER